MEPYEPCWCESGKKWKFCHRNRGEQKPVNFFEASKKLREEFEKGRCYHPQAPVDCSDKIISAHTLQNSGALSKIAEKGHVFSARESLHRIHQNKGKLIPQLTGVNRASTFMGFCNKHDTHLFLPIEQGELPINAEGAFLLTFRTVAYELHAKLASIQGMKAQAELMDRGRPLMEQAFIQDVLRVNLVGMEQSLEELTNWKRDLDDRFTSKDYTGLRMLAVRFQGGLPVVATGAFHPEFDFSGQRLQSLMDIELDQVAFTVTYSGDDSVAVFSWSGQEGGANEKFVRSFAALPSGEQATRMVLMCLVHSENTHMRPSWWNGLTPDQQGHVSNLMGLGVGATRAANSLVPHEQMPTVGLGVDSLVWI